MSSEVVECQIESAIVKEPLPSSETKEASPLESETAPMEGGDESSPMERDNNPNVEGLGADTAAPSTDTAKDEGSTPAVPETEETATPAPAESAPTPDSKSTSTDSSPAESKVVSSNSLLAVPSLIGKLARDHSFRGIWAMSDAAHQIAGQTAPFEYRLLKAFSGSSNNLAELDSSASSASGAGEFPCSGKYHGWFHLLANGKVLKVEENNLMLQFTPCRDSSTPTGEGGGVEKYTIVGDGSNKFGKFNVRGHATVSDGNMKLYKQYEYSSLTINKPKKLGSPSAGGTGAPKLQRSFSGEGVGTGAGASGGGARHSLSISTTAAGTGVAGGAGTPRESSGRIKKPSIHLLAAESGYVPGEKKTPRAGASTPRGAAGSGEGDAAVVVTSTTKAASKQPVAAAAAAASAAACLSRAESSGGSSRAQRLSQVMVKCNNLVGELMRHPAGVYFLTPVDPVALGIPDYPTIVTMPMDLGTVKSRLEAGEITTAESFAELVRLVFRNALTYNQLKENPVRIAAKTLSSRFEDRFRHLMSQQSQFVDPSVASVAAIASAASAAGAGGGKASGHGKKSPGGVGGAGAAKSASGGSGGDGPTKKYRASTGGLGGSSSRGVSGSSANLTANTAAAVARMSSSASAAGGAYAALTPRVMDETQHTLQEMKGQIKKLQDEVLELRKHIMRQEVSQLLDEKVEAAHHQMTLEEKERLIASINALPPEKMPKVIEIIQAAITANRIPGVKEDDDMEIPIDDLDTYTLRQLQKFVDDDHAERKKRLMLPDASMTGDTNNSSGRNGYQPAAKKAKRESSSGGRGAGAGAGSRSPKPKPVAAAVARSTSQQQTYFAGESFDTMRGISSSGAPVTSAVTSASGRASAAGGYNVGGGWDGDELDLDVGEPDLGGRGKHGGPNADNGGGGAPMNSISNILPSSSAAVGGGSSSAYGHGDDEVDLQDGSYGDAAGSQTTPGEEFVYLDAGDM